MARALGRVRHIDDCELIFFGREDCDLSAPKSIVADFVSNLPECKGMIISAAFTAVDAAETDKASAENVNLIAPGLIAEECSKRKIPLIHVSTDYVFSGEGNRPWQETDQTNPVNFYGQSKLEGENAIARSGCTASILRTSWVFDGTGKNFFTTMTKLGETRDQLNVVSDQIGRPTYAGHLANACAMALKQCNLNRDGKTRIFHVSGTGDPISWADFASEIFARTRNYRQNQPRVKPIPSSEYPTPAKRPKYSVLNTDYFERYHNFNLPDWRDGLSAAIDEWKESRNF